MCMCMCVFWGENKDSEVEEMRGKEESTDLGGFLSTSPQGAPRVSKG